MLGIAFVQLAQCGMFFFSNRLILRRWKAVCTPCFFSLTIFGTAPLKIAGLDLSGLTLGAGTLEPNDQEPPLPFTSESDAVFPGLSRFSSRQSSDWCDCCILWIVRLICNVGNDSEYWLAEASFHCYILRSILKLVLYGDGAGLSLALERCRLDEYVDGQI